MKLVYIRLVVTRDFWLSKRLLVVVEMCGRCVKVNYTAGLKSLGVLFNLLRGTFYGMPSTGSL